MVVQDTDRYGRTVGRVYVDSLDINAALVKRGAAWVYRQYSRDPGLLVLEQQAKAAKRGLWALPPAQQIPPWDWRHGGSASVAPAPTADPTPSPTANGRFACGGKRSCREMTSCEEARFYLARCGLTTIDGDRDGQPCEALCR